MWSETVVTSKQTQAACRSDSNICTWLSGCHALTCLDHVVCGDLNLLTCCVLPKADTAGVAAQLLAVGAALPGCAARGTKCVTLSTPFTSMLT
jgi:hypothetical protein